MIVKFRSDGPVLRRKHLSDFFQSFFQTLKLPKLSYRT